MNDQDIKKILEESKTIAMIGVSSEKKKKEHILSLKTYHFTVI